MGGVRMMRASILNMAAVCLCVALAGCAAMEKLAPKKKPKAKPTPAEKAQTPHRRVGTVALVNNDLHFVLIDVGTLYTPEAGTALKSFSGGVETGILAVDPEKRRPFVVADIVKGEPKVGDDVVE
jgi:hypothetical protein